MKTRLIEKLTIVSLIGLISVLLYFILWPFNPVTLKTISIDKTVYKKNDYVGIHLEFTKWLNVAPKIDWYIVDGIVYKMESPGTVRDVGENSFTTYKQIPESILPGTYHFRIELTYKVHPLHSDIHYSWNTPDFLVKE